MLTPEDIEKLKPKFEEIHRHLDTALIRSDADIPEDACGHYITSLALMEELVDAVTKKEGYGTKEALKRVVDAANSAEGAGVAGLGIGAASSLSLTGLGGFGLAAGGTALGVSGLAGATVATGGAALAGAAALYLAYRGGAAILETELGQNVVDQVATAGKKSAEQAKHLAYKGGAAVLETELGQNVVDQVATAGKKSAEQAKSIGKRAAEGLNEMRNVRYRLESKRDAPPGTGQGDPCSGQQSSSPTHGGGRA